MFRAVVKGSPTSYSTVKQGNDTDTSPCQRLNITFSLEGIVVKYNVNSQLNTVLLAGTGIFVVFYQLWGQTVLCPDV